MQRSMFFVVVVLSLLIGPPPSADACTVFGLKAGDGSVLVGRSMEFAIDLKYDAVVVPRNKAYASPAPGGKGGLFWKSRYGYVGIASLGMDYGVSDGMNEKGLAVGLLWYESDMKWPEINPGDEKRALAQVMVGDWILGNFASVEEVRREIGSVKVFSHSDPITNISPTLHFIVYDANGGCIVIEYEEGQCHIYDNPLLIMTNAPRFPWQLTNLRQYVGMVSEKPEPYRMAGMTFPATGHGSGMFGLPGDLSPPSRFVRLAVLTRFADRQPDGERTLNLAQHIINTFTIPFGLVTDTLPDKKTVLKESTQWVTFRDLTKRLYYFKTYENQTLRKIDLNRLDFSGAAVKRLPLFGTAEIVVDVTDQAR